MNYRRILLPSLLLGLAASAMSQSNSTKWVTLAQELPRAAATSMPVGAKPSTDRLHISIALPAANLAALQQFADSASDPKSPNYRHFLSPSQVGQKFGISASNIKKVTDYLASQGIKVRLVAQNRLSILADCTVAQAQAAFNTNIEQYLPLANGQATGEVKFAPTTAPNVPASIKPLVSYVGGLENFLRPKPRALLTPAQLRTLYNIAPAYQKGSQGLGRTIAISNYVNYGLQNIPLMYAKFSLPTPAGGVGSNVSVVPIDNENGNVTKGAPGEGDIDIQCALAMAPLANLIIYDNANNGDILGVLTQEADDNKADIVSESYGWQTNGYTAYFQACNAEHLSMTAQGITYVAAAGDEGAPEVNQYQYPDEDPEVLIVGGTTVQTDSSGNRQSEVVWNGGSGSQGAGGWAVDTDPFNVLPAYQKGNGVPTNIPYRLIPDIAMDSDPDSGYEIFLNGVFQPSIGEEFGGTSCASPTFAGDLADAEEYIIANGGLPADANGKQRLGRIQDLLYSFNGDSTVFFDVTSGTNGLLPNGQTSTATVGWDTASGWGAPIMSGLITKILNQTLPSSLAFSPSSVQGGATSTGTITLTTAAPAGGLAVTLSSGNASVTVPSFVTVAAGATTATFTATTTAVSSTTAVTINATANNTTISATLTVTAVTLGVQSLTLSPTAVIGGSTSTGTVTLGVPAGTSGTLVALTSSSSSATVPSTVTVAPGETTATFTVSTTAVSSSTPVTITATQGSSTQTVALTVNPAVPTSITFNPPAVAGGSPSTGTVLLNGPAPTAGTVFNLSSNNASATVPISVTVINGATSGSFTVSTTTVSANTNAVITATAGSTSLSGTLVIQPPLLNTVSVAPASTTGGNQVIGTVTLSRAAPSNGATITLSSSSSNISMLPFVQVPAGATSATFNVNTTGVTAKTACTVTASQGSTTRTTTLTLLPATLAGISIGSPSIKGGSSVIGGVSLTGIAPTGGLKITLSSNNTNATVPASITVPAGAWTTGFTVTTKPVTVPTKVTLKATKGAVSYSATLLLEPITLESISINPSAFVGGSNQAVTGAVTITSSAPSAGTTVTLKSSNTAVLTVPASVKVTSGATSASFVVTHKVVTVIKPVTITATCGGVSQTFYLTVNPFLINSLTLSPASVQGGTSVAGEAALNAIPGSASVAVKLTSTSKAITFPASVSVLKGANTVSFTVKTVGVAALTEATLVGTVADSSASASISIESPQLLSLVVAPTTVKGSSTTLVKGTITLTSPAPAAGFVVTLTSSNAAALTVPATVKVLSGKTTATFTVTHKKVTTQTSPTITASAIGVTKTATLTVTP